MESRFPTGMVVLPERFACRIRLRASYSAASALKQVAHLFILQPFLVINSGISVGPQAAAKFKNVKDRWLKIVSASEGARKSGAGGEAGKVHTKWTLFDIVDGMLRHTPNYAERSSSNVPPEEDVSILPSPLSSNSPSSRRLVASCISSPAATLFQEMYSDSPNDFTDEDDLRLPSTSESAASAAGSSGLSTSQAGVAAPDPGSAKRRASNGPSSRTKRRQSDSFEEAVKDVLGSCSATLLELKKKEMPAPTDDSQEAANWIAAKLRMLPHKKRREFFKPNERIWTLYSNTTKNITCVNDRTTRNTEREVTINRTFVMDGNNYTRSIKPSSISIFPNLWPKFGISSTLFACSRDPVEYYV
ncbi:uncharacterized protein [Dermacentor andersoni]|uniref:uncharacterized protein isoform X4 n=1 Tax=Dermacentor andersoni TaxID=34620 RepID=UPI003B3AF5C4